MPSPATIEEMLDFARESLGIGYPISDLVHPNVFPLLMEDVTLALKIGKEVIGGVSVIICFSAAQASTFRYGFQRSGPPLPRKYVVTDRGTPELLSITTLVERLERSSGGGRCSVQIRAAKRDQSDHVHETKRRV